MIHSPRCQYGHPGRRRQHGRADGRPHPRLRTAQRARRPQPDREFDITGPQRGGGEEMDRQVQRGE